MKKNLYDIFTDGATPSHELITEAMVVSVDAGLDKERIATLATEKLGLSMRHKSAWYRQYYKQLAAVAACFMLIVVTAVLIRLTGNLGNVDYKEPIMTDDVSDDGIIWGDEHETNALGDAEAGDVNDTADEYESDDNIIGGPITEDAVLPDVEAYHSWNGLFVSDELLEKLTEADATAEQIFAVSVNLKESYLSSINNDFIYDGKTIGEWIELRDESRLYMMYYQNLIKHGAELIYGEALYKTGLPNGDKWAKELYEEQLLYYGEVWERARNAYENAIDEKGLRGVDDDRAHWYAIMEPILTEWSNDEAWNFEMTCETVADAYTECRKSALADAKEVFVSLGVAVAEKDEFISAYGHSLVLFVTYEELISLGNSENMDDYILSLAYKSIFKSDEESAVTNRGDDYPTDDTVDEAYTDAADDY